MVNRSKANDPRFWKRWRESGAVGTVEDAYKVYREELAHRMYNKLREVDTIEDAREPKIRQMYNKLREVDTIEDAREPKLTSYELLPLLSRQFGF